MMRKQIFAVTGAAAMAVAAGLFAAGSARADTTTPAANTSSTWTASYQATLRPVVANRSAASGTVWVTLHGRSADIKLQVSGLVDGIHPANIHIDGHGECPIDAQVRDHRGLPSITTSDAVASYGKIGTALTTTGDTSSNSGLAMDRFPHGGDYLYSRTIELDPDVINSLGRGKAVLLVHGIDYNGNKKYDNVLGASELETSLPAEATDPAACGAFVVSQMGTMPSGSANTGGGSTAHPSWRPGRSTEFAGGVAALIAAGLVLLRRRRPVSTGR